MEWIIIILFAIVSLLLEGGSIAVPLFVGTMLTLFVLFQKSRVLVVASLFSLALDVLLFQPLGVTSLFLLCMFAFVLLYERKFEIQTPQFVATFTLISSFLYQTLFRGSHMLISALLTMLWALFLFFIIARLDVLFPAVKRK